MKLQHRYMLKLTFDAHIKKMPWIQSSRSDLNSLYASSSPSLRYDASYYSIKDSSTTLSPQPSTSSSNKITPAILFIIVILAVIFFVSGLLHLLVRFLTKHRSSSSSSLSNSSRYPDMIGSNTYQRQLQQLFNLHDSGLDQSFIDALPVFHYREIMMDGLKEPFDCPVCLCEFSPQDKLRLLPLCSHAFHIKCIDTWLLSNSTCPLCRGSLYSPGLPLENPVFDFDDAREEVCFSGRFGDGIVSSGAKPSESAIMNGKRVFSVRLGKYRNVNIDVTTREKEEAEASNSNLDARRCYSMGSFQYVVANSDLQVSLRHNKPTVPPSGEMRIEKRGQNGKSSIDEDFESKKINVARKNESFSVSKVWLWSKKGKLTSSSNAHIGVDLGSPWTNTTQPV